MTDSKLPDMDNLSLGKRGEAAAARYLESAGMKIIERGRRIGRLEIDLIAKDGGEVVFVEVKTRRTHEFGYPEESVTAEKRERLRRAAVAYLEAAGRPATAYRIDVVALTVPDGGGKAFVRHIRGAVEDEE